jgi:hypothetical protein
MSAIASFNSFKKSASILCLCLLATSSLSARPARANVIGGPIAIVAGGSVELIYGLTAGGLVLALGGGITGYAASQTGNRTLYKIAVISLLVGVVLDSENSSMAFAPIRATEARCMGLSDRAVSLINDNIDELNAVANEVSSELGSMSGVTLNDSRAAWERMLPALDSDLRGAVHELMAKLPTSACRATAR